MPVMVPDWCKRGSCHASGGTRQTRFCGKAPPTSQWQSSLWRPLEGLDDQLGFKENLFWRPKTMFFRNIGLHSWYFLGNMCTLSQGKTGWEVVFFKKDTVSFSVFLSLSVSVVLFFLLHSNFYFFSTNKKVQCHAPRTTLSKFEKKNERKLTESQRIKNMLAEI